MFGIGLQVFHGDRRLNDNTCRKPYLIPSRFGSFGPLWHLDFQFSPTSLPMRKWPTSSGDLGSARGPAVLRLLRYNPFPKGRRAMCAPACTCTTSRAGANAAGGGGKIAGIYFPPVGLGKLSCEGDSVLPRNR